MLHLAHIHIGKQYGWRLASKIWALHIPSNMWQLWIRQNHKSRGPENSELSCGNCRVVAGQNLLTARNIPSSQSPSSTLVSFVTSVEALQSILETFFLPLVVVKSVPEHDQEWAFLLRELVHKSESKLQEFCREYLQRQAYAIHEKQSPSQHKVLHLHIWE